MKTLTKLYPKEGLWLHEMPEPQIGPNDVLIKIKKTAICGTDVHIYNWDEWAQKTIRVPLVAGHEFAGEIIALGSEVVGLAVGDRVSGEGHISCGYCRNCRAGKRHLCRNTSSVGAHRQGCFAEFLAMPAVNVFKLSAEISDDVAAMLDPFGNATHTALSFDLVGEDVLITGAGPVGIMAAAVAKHAGARYVVVTDINDYRLDLAKKMGATIAVNTTKTMLTDIMRDLRMSEGFDVGLEMSGNPYAFNDMLANMNHGGRIALLGFLPNNTQIDWNKIILKGLFVKGIYGREMFETWYKMASLLQSGLDLSPMITHRYPIAEFEAGLQAMRSGLAGKVILDWEA